MVDTNYKKIEEGQIATVRLYGHILKAEIYEVENEKVFFRVINRKTGEPHNGYFNRIEAKRYLTVRS